MDAEVTYSGTAQMTLKTKLVLTKLGKNETLLLERERYVFDVIIHVFLFLFLFKFWWKQVSILIRFFLRKLNEFGLHLK